MATTIENLAAWRTHWAAVDAAKASGACSDCAQKSGFEATSAAEGKPTPPILCHRAHRPDHPWANANRAMHEEWAAARKERAR